MNLVIIQNNKERAKKLKRNSYKFEHISFFSEDGYAYARKESDSTWCIIDIEGNIISEKNNYIYHARFNEGLSAVSKDNKKYGVIDIYGNTKIEFEYDFINEFHNGLAVVRLGDFGGVINTNEEVILPIKYKGLSFDLNEGIGTFMTNSNREDRVEYALVDIDGNELHFKTTRYVHVDHSSIKNLLNQEPVVVKKISDIELNDNILYSLRAEGMGSRTLFRVDKDLNRTVYHIKGNIVRSDENIFSTRRQYFTKTSSGYYNINGKMIVESTKFDHISSFINGFGVVGAQLDRKNHNSMRYNFINKFGKIGSDTNYDFISPLVLERKMSYKKDLAVVSQGRCKGLINSNGELLIPCKYKEIVVIYHGVAACYGSEEGFTLELF